MPGALHDLNTLEVSSHFHDVSAGILPPLQPSFNPSGKLFTWFYYLTDGIYPSWKCFIKIIPSATSTKLKYFSQCQEGVRKCVEWMFWVLFRRFRLLYVASEFWGVSKMRDVASCAVCLHNMVVEGRDIFIKVMVLLG